MKTELSLSEMLQKQINKINKKQQENLKLIAECKKQQDGLNDNQINIMDLIK